MHDLHKCAQYMLTIYGIIICSHIKNLPDLLIDVQKKNNSPGKYMQSKFMQNFIAEMCSRPDPPILQCNHTTMHVMTVTQPCPKASYSRK